MKKLLRNQKFPNPTNLKLLQNQHPNHQPKNHLPRLPRKYKKKTKKLTKTQLQKQKKKQKQEEETKAKEKAEKAEAEKRALEEKREAARAKKAASKAQKSPAAKPQAPPQAAVEAPKEEVLEEGWELPNPRKTKSKSGSSKGGAEKKVKEPTSAIEIQVPVKLHGQIIGKEGAFLKLIEKKSGGAKITMPKKSGGGLGVTVTGPTTAVKEAERIIKEIIDKGYSSVTHPEMTNNEIDLQNPKLIGRIAGPNGSYIKKIQEKTNVRVNFPDKDSKGSVLTLLGKQSDIMNAKIAINDLLNQGFCEITHPNWIAEEVDFPSEFLGKLIGEHGAKIKSLSTQYGVKIDTPKKEDGKQDVIVIKGLREKIEKAKEAIADILVVNNEPDEPPVPEPDDPWQQSPEEAEW